MSDEDDRAPNYPPFTITITWAPGDSLYLNAGGLLAWEVRSVLDEARTLVEEDETSDSEVGPEEP